MTKDDIKMDGRNSNSDGSEVVKKDMKLTPVIEFGPELFRKDSRDYPSFDLAQESYRKAYKEFWYAMLADWGISDVKPYAEGSEFVILSEISDQTLEILIDRELAISEWAEETSPEDVSRFYGGLILEYGSQIIEPSCCGDLGNFSEWEDLTRSPIGEVKQLWIGHPWINVEDIDGENMRLYMQCEQSSELLVDLIINQSKLLQHIEKAKHEMSNFNDRVIAALKRKSYPRDLAQALTGWENKDIK